MDNLTLTIGQYLKGDSWLHRLDPRFKIIAVTILMIALFLLPSILYIGVALILLLIVIISARLPLLHIIKGLKPIIFLSLFSFILQVVYTNQGDLLYTFTMNISINHILISILVLVIYIFTNKFIPFKLLYLILCAIGIFCLFAFVDFNNNFLITNFDVYQQGIINGFFFVGRIMCLIVITTLLTLTTSTIDLNCGIERVLKPLKVIKVPVAELALMTSLTLRFVPTLLLETNKILKAQASRGVDFAEGSLIQKAKQIVTLLIPMFNVSFKRADDLAYAMEARGYVIGSERSSLNVLKFKSIDYIGFVVVVTCLITSICLQVIL